MPYCDGGRRSSGGEVVEDDELLEIVEHIHIHWNTRLSSTNKVRKLILEVWKSALHDLPHSLVKRAVLEIALAETFMPRPAQVRKKAIQLSGTVVPPLESAAAWAEVQKLARSVTSGAIDNHKVDPHVLTAINKMGGLASIAHSTNGDRTQFCDVYAAVVTEWESQAYAFVD